MDPAHLGTGEQIEMNRAAIDIGSNSLLLTIIDQSGVVLHDSAKVIGLGVGVDDLSVFAPERMRAAEAVLSDYLATAAAHGVKARHIKVVATSAARRAMNAQTWFAHLQRSMDIRPRIISGQEEARLTWRGALFGISDQPSPYMVIDLGGGSTEVIIGDRNEVSFSESLEIGSVRLTERCLSNRPVSLDDLTQAREYIHQVASCIPLEFSPKTVIGVAGTVTSLSAILLELRRFDATIVHHHQINHQVLNDLISRLAAASDEQIERISPCSPKRAPNLLAGALIISSIMDRVGAENLLVSTYGLRFGLLRPAEPTS